MARMTLRRIDPISAGKITGVTYAVLGLIIGGIFSIVSMFGLAVSGNNDAGIAGAIMGMGAVIIVPILYGGLGFVGTLIAALIYNLMAKWVGGVVIDLE